MAHRETINALRELFPQVDGRIIKATVMDHGEDMEAAMDFIVTEVLGDQSSSVTSSPLVVMHLHKPTVPPSYSAVEAPPMVAKESVVSDFDDASEFDAPEIRDALITGPQSVMLQDLPFRQLAGNGHIPIPGDLHLLLAANSQPDLTHSIEETADACAPLGDLLGSVYGSVPDMGSDLEQLQSDKGCSRLEDSWDASEANLENQLSETLHLAAPSVQNSALSHYSNEVNMNLESASLEETLQDAYDNSWGNSSSGSMHLLSLDVLDELVQEAKANKEGLLGEIEYMCVLRGKAEQAEAAARQAKEDAAHSGMDVLVQAEKLCTMLARARQTNEMHAGEVYGEKAVLATESRELQLRLAQIKAEKAKALLAITEMRATLQARIDRAIEETEEAEAEKQQKEASAREVLAKEESLLAKVAQESRDLDAEAEVCTKLREFLIERGSFVDSLQGEVAIICEDVEALKKQLEAGLLTWGSGYVHMSSRSSSQVSGSSLSPKADRGYNNTCGALSHSGSSYRSATRAADISESSSPHSAEAEGKTYEARLGIFAGETDLAMQGHNLCMFCQTGEGADDDDWHLLDVNSSKASRSSSLGSAIVEQGTTGGLSVAFPLDGS